MTRQLLPFSNSPFQTNAEPACLYLLASAADQTACKLGVTNHLAARLDSLRQSDGALDLSRSIVFAARSRRDAFDLEAILRAVFAAPRWRATPKSLQTNLGGRHHNGSSEWYHIRAFQPMVAFISELIEHDKRSGDQRYHLDGEGNQLASWYEATRQERSRRQQLPRNHEAEQANHLARNEASFVRVQEWIESRHGRLIEVQPICSASGSNIGSTFVFRAPFGGNPSARHDFGRGCEELASQCVMSYRRERACGSISYFDGAQFCEETCNFAIGLCVTPRFEEIAGYDPRFADLASRIKDWLTNPHHGQAEG